MCFSDTLFAFKLESEVVGHSHEVSVWKGLRSWEAGFFSSLLQLHLPAFSLETHGQERAFCSTILWSGLGEMSTALKAMLNSRFHEVI